MEHRLEPYKGNPMTNKWVNIETGFSEAYQLYHLVNDPRQQNNLAQQYPDKVKEMEKTLNAIQK